MAERYQREIEDILGKLESGPLAQPQAGKHTSKKWFLAPIGRMFGKWISPGRIMLSALALLLVALLFKASMPGFMLPVLMGGVFVVFILGYAMFFINASESQERRWRDHPIENPSSSLPRWKKWLQGKNR